MKYGWNIGNELTFGELSRDFYYANLLVDNILAENLTEVRSLLETKSANPNTVMPELGVAPLHLLAGLENEDFSSTVTLQAILRNGGDPNVRSEEGLTPVHVAAMWGRSKVLDILLANGGDPELIDYKMFLNAEEYALKEKQWKAYGVLCTFSVMAEEGYNVDAQYHGNAGGSEKSSDLSNMFNKEFKNNHPMKSQDLRNYSDSSSIKDSENCCRYSTIRKKKKSKKSSLTDDESYSDRSDWSKNTVKFLNLNSVLNSVKRPPSLRKNKKINEKDQLDNEFLSDQSNTSNKTIKQLRANEGTLSTIKEETALRKNNKINKTQQTYNEWNSDQSDWSKSTVQSLKLNYNALSRIRKVRRKTNIYESLGVPEKMHKRNKLLGKESKEKSKVNKLSLYGDSVSESCDWIRKSKSSINLDKNALAAISNQRLRSKIYQTKGLGEDPLKEREKIPPLYEESEVCDWVDARNHEPFDESSINKINIHRTRTEIYKNEDKQDTSEVCSAPKLPRRNRKMHNGRKEDSEMYLCGYTEESVSTNRHQHQHRPRYPSSGLSDLNSSDFDERGIPNQRMLCKMSRIFLFMLKKRHIYQKIK